MDFEYYSVDNNAGNLDSEFTYYKVYSDDVNEYNSPAFCTEESAVEYAITLGGKVSTLKEIALFSAENGRVYKEEYFKGFIPNLENRVITYTIIAEDPGDEELVFIGFFADDKDKYDLLPEYVKSIDEYYNGRISVGLYRVTVTINEDNKSISKKYELLHEIKKYRTR